MKPDDRVRLRHIADALGAAIRFTEGRSREDLDKDQMLAFALLHAIQIVGEAASRISAEFRDQHPQTRGRSLPACVTGWYTPTSISITTSCGRRLRSRFPNSWTKLTDFSHRTERRLQAERPLRAFCFPATRAYRMPSRSMTTGLFWVSMARVCSVAGPMSPCRAPRSALVCPACS